MPAGVEVPVFSSPATAVHFTSVVPTGNVEPDGGVQRKEWSSSSEAVAVAVYDTTAPDALVAGVVMLDGTVIVGAAPNSTAPIEHGFPRFAPRWSVKRHCDSSPAPIAGLPGFRECTGVVPPLLSSDDCSSG